MLYVVRTTTTGIALSAAATKTLVNVIAGSDEYMHPTAMHVSFNGTDITKEPVLIEICKSTQATAGTSTAQTPVQLRGQTRGAQCAGAINYTVEPTVLTVLFPMYISPAGGHWTMQYPLGREAEINAAGLAIRATTVTGVTPTVHAWIEFTE